MVYKPTCASDLKFSLRIRVCYLRYALEVSSNSVWVSKSCQGENKKLYTLKDESAQCRAQRKAMLLFHNTGAAKTKWPHDSGYWRVRSSDRICTSPGPRKQTENSFGTLATGIESSQNRVQLNAQVVGCCWLGLISAQIITAPDMMYETCGPQHIILDLNLADATNNAARWGPVISRFNMTYCIVHRKRNKPKRQNFVWQNQCLATRSWTMKLHKQ